MVTVSTTPLGVLTQLASESNSSIFRSTSPRARSRIANSEPLFWYFSQPLTTSGLPSSALMFSAALVSRWTM